jgi:hypothetical protein
MEKEDKQKVIGENAVWTSLILLGLLEREPMAKYIKPRTKTQVHVAMNFFFWQYCSLNSEPYIC